MSKIKVFFLLGCMVFSITGCIAKTVKEVPLKKTAEVTKRSDNKTGPVVNVNADWDFKTAIQKAVKSMMQSNILDNPSGERYIVTVSNIKDFTNKGFNTKDIKKRLEEALRANRKKVRMDKTVTPQIMIAGRIMQRTATLASGKKRQEVSLYLVLTDVKSGTPLGTEIKTLVFTKGQKKYSQ